MLSNNMLIFIMLFIAGSSIVLFQGNFKYLDPIILDNPKLTYWSATHFLVYYAIGKMCPNKYLFFLFVGIMWELIEKIYGTLRREEQYWTSGGYKGQIIDIIINLLGYHLAHIKF